MISCIDYERQPFEPSCLWLALDDWTPALFSSVEHRIDYMRNSMSKVSPEMARIQSAVKDAGMTTVLGCSERGGNSII